MRWKSWNVTSRESPTGLEWFAKRMRGTPPVRRDELAALLRAEAVVRIALEKARRTSKGDRS